MLLCDGEFLVYFCFLYFWNVILVVDGLDFRQWCDGNDCCGYCVGDVFVKFVYGGDRFFLWYSGGVIVGYFVFSGDYVGDVVEYVVVLYQSGGDGVFYWD